MKRLYQIISSTILFVMVCITAIGQDNSPWKNYVSQIVSGVLFAPGSHEYSLSSGQGFLVYLRNDNKVAVTVSGIMTARTTCGNIVSTRFKLTLAPGEINAGSDNDKAKASGQSGWVSAAECAGVKYAKIPKYVNRISNVSLGDIRVTPVSGSLSKLADITPSMTPVREANLPVVTAPVVSAPKFDSLGFYRSQWNYTKDSLMNEISSLRAKNNALLDTINYKTVIYNNLQNTLLNSGKKKKK
ncbi:hypothetical protein ACFOW1_08065 [Parasediminibacterium paludis]|uniref:Uncharacterized protein n=1 Tax=Parasediminibacterium paludis TaxID=908966 RepID=A0ABV8PUY2_9BACT